MLNCLKIENIAVIREAELETGSGLTVLTGETGAGKSIIIDAIHAVMGRRTSKELIRTGYDRAQVSALFTDVNEQVQRACAELGVMDDSGELLLQRRMSADGRNVCHINGQPVTLSVLRSVAEHLVNIHGQQDNQQLLRSENHCAFVDAFADNHAEREAYLAVFNRLKATKKQLNALNALNIDKQQRIDMLTFAVRELKAAKIQPGEMEQLKQQRAQARNSERLIEAFQSVIAALNGDGETEGTVTVLEQISETLQRIGDVYSPSKELTDKIMGYSYDLQAIADTLSGALETVQYNAGELEKIEERLDMYNRYSKKYGATEQEMLNYLQSAKDELESITTADEQIAKLERQSAQIEQELVQVGERLTRSRIEAGERFAREVCDVLKYLQMPNVQFVVSNTQGTYTKNGCDRIEFLISANLGEPPKPLTKIASGGEMSRIMLAIKSVLLSADDVDTLIFDEIDTGISGYAAGKVGNKLKELSRAKQVICITHLAQIAALADYHLLISKVERENETFTLVQRLEGDDRIEEISRIMAGGKMTENLYNSAKELLEKGENEK